MSETPNYLTLAAYNADVETYVKCTPPTPEQSPKTMLEWIDTSLEFVPKKGKVLEIGSAIPRDARYIRSKDYIVQCSDGASGFVAHLQRNGEDAILIDILKDPIPATFDMIFANAVLSHFTEDDLDLVFSKVSNSLPKKGVFAFSVKRGSGEQWVREKIKGERYIHYWQSEDVKSLLHSHGFKLVFTSSNIGNFPDHEWMNFTAVKI